MILSDFNPTQKLIGAALVLVLWLVPAGAVWLYERGQVHAAYNLGKADAQAASATDLLKANEKAIADWKAAQADVDAGAKQDAAHLATFLAQAESRAHSILEAQKAYALAHPLPADCRADPERVRMLNQARQDPAAAAH